MFTAPIKYLSTIPAYLIFLACASGTVFFAVSPCLTQFFFTGRPRLTQAGLPSPRGGLTSHRQTPHREASPHTEKSSLTQRGPTSHREASPHTERPHLTQGGLPSPHTGKPHADMLPSQEGLTSHRQTLHRHSSSRMSVPKKTNK